MKPRLVTNSGIFLLEDLNSDGFVPGRNNLNGTLVLEQECALQGYIEKGGKKHYFDLPSMRNALRAFKESYEYKHANLDDFLMTITYTEKDYYNVGQNVPVEKVLNESKFNLDFTECHNERLNEADIVERLVELGVDKVFNIENALVKLYSDTSDAINDYLNARFDEYGVNFRRSNKSSRLVTILDDILHGYSENTLIKKLKDENLLFDCDNFTALIVY